MNTIHHARNLLARETGHLVGAQRHQVAAMMWDATLFAERCPAADANAIAIKLLTLHDGAERWVRLLVAKAAMESVAVAQAA